MADDANNAPTDYLYIPYNPLIFSNNIHLLVEMLELRAVLDTLIVTTHTHVHFPHQHPTQSRWHIALEGQNKLGILSPVGCGEEKGRN